MLIYDCNFVFGKDVEIERNFCLVRLVELLSFSFRERFYI